MQVNLFFDWLSNGELLTLKTGPPCIGKISTKIHFKTVQFTYTVYMLAILSTEPSLTTVYAVVLPPAEVIPKKHFPAC